MTKNKHPKNRLERKLIELKHEKKDTENAHKVWRKLSELQAAAKEFQDGERLSLH